LRQITALTTGLAPVTFTRASPHRSSSASVVDWIMISLSMIGFPITMNGIEPMVAP
jgi:hypothetical protein